MLSGDIAFVLMKARIRHGTAPLFKAIVASEDMLNFMRNIFKMAAHSLNSVFLAKANRLRRPNKSSKNPSIILKKKYYDSYVRLGLIRIER